MSGDPAADALAAAADQCSQCGACLMRCDLLNGADLTPGDIAERVRVGDIDDELVAVVQRCNLCDLCSVGCPEGMTTSLMMKAARGQLLRSGHISMTDYELMLVDRDWHAFTLYRDTWGIDYHDLGDEQYDTVFFPGCSLSSYSPELTRASYRWLRDTLGPLGFMGDCCGKPLEMLGLDTEAGDHLDRIRQRLRAAGARRLIVACPNCHAILSRHLGDFEVRTIYSVLLEAGVTIGGDETVTVHDACPDRFNAENVRNIRALIGGYPQVEMPSHGEEAICCGSGGLVSMIDPERCSCQAAQRLDEFAASGADTCLTSCLSCAYRLSRAGAESRVQHCLEKVFDIQVDYSHIEQRSERMWEGPEGQRNHERLAAAQVPVAGQQHGDD